MEPVLTPKRIGIMGGSFDPVHLGHLIIAQDALERLELDRILFVPAAVPPHKQHLQQAEAEHRLNMLKLAVEPDLRFAVSAMELERGGVSYTVDTLRRLKEEFPADKRFLIIGSDTLLDLHNWYKVDEILELCEVATLLRPGDGGAAALEQAVRFPPPVRERLMRHLIEAHLIGISSTEIRMRIAEGLGIEYLVPPEVKMYIFEHGLYQG